MGLWDCICNTNVQKTQRRVQRVCFAQRQQSRLWVFGFAFAACASGTSLCCRNSSLGFTGFMQHLCLFAVNMQHLLFVETPLKLVPPHRFCCSYLPITFVLYTCAVIHLCMPAATASTSPPPPPPMFCFHHRRPAPPACLLSARILRPDNRPRTQVSRQPRQY